MEKFELDESTFEKVGEYIDKALEEDASLSFFALFEKGLNHLRELGIDENIITFLHFTAGEHATQCIFDSVTKTAYKFAIESYGFNCSYEEYVKEVFGDSNDTTTNEERRQRFAVINGGKDE